LNISPDLIIHCAAYTNVDDCENNMDLAFKINALGSRNITLVAKICNSSVVYISTDYIFDGSKKSPYNEFDIPKPINTYGKSKLAGEGYIKDFIHSYYIIRTSWLYGKMGHNFIKTILKLGKRNSELKVVDDQIGTPTDVKSLAIQIIKIIETGLYGTYNVSCNGYCSWYEFACEIIKLAGLDSKVIPIKTADYPLPAKRPSYSVLDNYILRLENNDIMPTWKDSLENFFNENSLEDLI
jgi:dTDP-4-dehydrorhamnose reductase